MKFQQTHEYENSRAVLAYIQYRYNQTVLSQLLLSYYTLHSADPCMLNQQIIDFESKRKTIVIGHSLVRNFAKN